MFYISRMAAESIEVRESIEHKISLTPDGKECEFLSLLLPAVQLALSKYDGMCGVTIAGELGKKKGTVNIVMYANELGE